MNWQAISVMCALATLVGTGFGIYVKLLLGSFQHQLFLELDARYVAAALCEERCTETNRRLDRLEKTAGYY